MLSIASLRVAGSALLISRVANNTNTGKRVRQFPIVTVLTAHRRMRYAVERALTGPPNPGRTVGAAIGSAGERLVHTEATCPPAPQRGRQFSKKYTTRHWL